MDPAAAHRRRPRSLATAALERSPEGTRSFALISAEVQELPEGLPRSRELPSGARCQRS